MRYAAKFLRFAVNFYRYIVVSRLAARKLSRLAHSCQNNVECIVKLAFEFNYKFPPLPSITIKPAQIYEEIVKLAKIFAKLRPRYVMEIGTANGGTLFLWCMLASDDATIISVDLPGGNFGGGYPRWRIPLYKSFRKVSQKLYLIRADSHDIRTLEIVKNVLRGNKLDFLFIDGDHTYEGVKKDFNMYVPLVRDNGIIALHDIVPGPPENVGGVPRFWREIKKRYRYIEIVKDWRQGGYGIGLIYKE
ncbi:class I SAM-dependent methyltransferase [Desulfurococcaceae archaeon MEX13E-LK6-19]|nr:class I SAM-dependent methyltransferase [Desulfurococcaceae archaeon MEX13E-LK6-19]